MTRTKPADPPEDLLITMWHSPYGTKTICGYLGITLNHLYERWSKLKDESKLPRWQHRTATKPTDRKRVVPPEIEASIELVEVEDERLERERLSCCPCCQHLKLMRKVFARDPRFVRYMEPEKLMGAPKMTS